MCLGSKDLNGHNPFMNFNLLDCPEPFEQNKQEDMVSNTHFKSIVRECSMERTAVFALCVCVCCCACTCMRRNLSSELLECLRAYLRRDPIAFSCWGRRSVTSKITCTNSHVHLQTQPPTHTLHTYTHAQTESAQTERQARQRAPNITHADANTTQIHIAIAVTIAIAQTNAYAHSSTYTYTQLHIHIHIRHIYLWSACSAGSWNGDS